MVCNDRDIGHIANLERKLDPRGWFRNWPDDLQALYSELEGITWEGAAPEQRDNLSRLNAEAERRGREISNTVNAFEMETRHALEAAQKERDAATAPADELDKLAARLWDEADAIEHEITNTLRP